MKFLKYFIITFIFVALTYCGSWFVMAHQLKKVVKQFYNIDGPLLGYNFYGDEPAISGFPFKPILTYDKGFAKGDYGITFKQIMITAIPYAGMPLNLEASDIIVQNSINGKRFDFDKLYSTLKIPTALPKDTSRAELAEWQKNVGEIKFDNIEIHKQELISITKGTIGLDSDLQPIAMLRTTMTDYAQLINFLIQTGELKQLPAAIALSVLNGMAQKDDVSDKEFVTFDVQLMNRKLSIGPIQAVTVPTVNWPEKTVQTN